MASALFPAKPFHLAGIPKPLHTPETVPLTVFHPSEMHWYDPATVVIRVSPNLITTVVLDD